MCEEGGVWLHSGVYGKEGKFGKANLEGKDILNIPFYLQYIVMHWMLRLLELFRILTNLSPLAGE